MKAILAVSGFKNSGKTTLCLKLASCLRQMGVRVGFVKHTHENVVGERVQTRVASCRKISPP